MKADNDGAKDLILVKLPIVTIGISPKLNITGLQLVQDAFQKDVLALKMTIMKDKKITPNQRFYRRPGTGNETAFLQ